MKYTLHYHPTLGTLIGVVDADNRNIPADEANHDWRQFLEWNKAQPKPLDLSQKKPQRPIE